MASSMLALRWSIPGGGVDAAVVAAREDWDYPPEWCSLLLRPLVAPVTLM